MSSLSCPVLRREDGVSWKAKRPRTKVVRQYPVGCGKPTNLAGSKDFGLQTEESVPPRILSEILPPKKRILYEFRAKRDYPVGCGKRKYCHTLENPSLFDDERFENPIAKVVRLSPLTPRILNEPIVHRYFPREHDFDLVSQGNDSVNNCGNQNFDSPQGKPLIKGQWKQNTDFVSNDFLSMNDATPLTSFGPPNKQGVDVSQSGVKDVLRLFHEMFQQRHEENAAKPITFRTPMTRVHIEIAMILKRQQKWVNTTKCLGSLPGIEIGDKFRFRAELCVVGLHGQFFKGIDYVRKDGCLLATSVVATNRYDNTIESSNFLIYLGEGGNPLGTTKRPIIDQKLKSGNLALINSMEARTPVRVVRGMDFATNFNSSNSFHIQRGGEVSYSKDRYVYDGLYLVDECWQERGENAKFVYKFRLRRMERQDKSTLCKPSKDCVVMDDLSQGKETVPIRVVNNNDDERLSSFTYITFVDEKFPSFSNVADKTISKFCGRFVFDDCHCDGCLNFKDCPCKVKNGREIVCNSEGMVRKAPVFCDCGPSCNYFPSGINKVSQQGIQCQLEVFRVDSKRWGLRTRSNITLGSFVCEYIRKILANEESKDNIEACEQLLDAGSYCGYCSTKDDLSLPNLFCASTNSCGNVGTFIYHDPSPNLCAKIILFEDDDHRTWLRVMMYAMKDILSQTELTCDYNAKLPYRINFKEFIM